MRALAIFSAAALLLAMSTGGCVSRAIKETVGVASGPKGVVAWIEPPVRPQGYIPLSGYTNYTLQMNEGFGRTPSQVLSLLEPSFEHQLAEKRIPNYGSGPTVIVRGTIIHYESSTTVGQALGPLEEVIARVELVDSNSGKLIATANCIGRTQETVNGGPAKKAEGLAKALVNMIDALYPPRPKE